MYLECRICKRVTQHKEVDNHSRTYQFATGLVKVNTYYICPHCNTGVSGTKITSNIGSNITCTFEKMLG